MPLADGGPIDETSTLLLVAAVLLGWFASRRLCGRAFRSMPRAVALAAAALAVAAVALAFVLPPILSSSSTARRPSTSARLGIIEPRQGDVLVGDPATVVVRLDLRGARIVPFTSTTLTSDTGHVHLYLDGALVSMTYGLSQRLEVTPGRHALLAEFVAVDHAPFDPRVEARVTFRVRP